MYVLGENFLTVSRDPSLHYSPTTEPILCLTVHFVLPQTLFHTLVLLTNHCPHNHIQVQLVYHWYSTPILFVLLDHHCSLLHTMFYSPISDLLPHLQLLTHYTIQLFYSSTIDHLRLLVLYPTHLCYSLNTARLPHTSVLVSKNCPINYFYSQSLPLYFNHLCYSPISAPLPHTLRTIRIININII